MRPDRVMTETLMAPRFFHEWRAAARRVPRYLSFMDSAHPQRSGDYIDGAFRVAARADGELRIVSPADARDTTAVHRYARAALDDALAAARRAFPAWRRTKPSERAALLLRYRERLRAHRDPLASTLAREVGKPLWEALTEVDAMIAKIDLTLGAGARYTEDQVVPELPGEIRHRPHGVVAVIGPFNFPGHLPNGQLVPALLLGNCVVHKPSERTPSAATWMARCVHEAGFPQGVFSVVHGPAAFGAALATHPEVDAVMFTGSAAVGQRIVQSQGGRLDRLIALELGGKNSSIALGDCDLERSARAIAYSAFVTAGQRCTATSQLLVTRDIADALVARIVEITRGLRIGHPLDADVFMGPMISPEARARLFAAQARALAAGFTALLAGGACEVRDRKGHYALPAIHCAPQADACVPGYSDEELFGPDLAVHVVDDLDHALALANRSRFGLAAAVFTRSRERLEHAADELRVGTLHWNRPSAGASSRLPFGGIKDSGNHRPAGIFAGASCVYPLAVLLERPETDPLPSWPGTFL